MRNSILLALLLAIFVALPTPVHAQDQIKFERLDVQIWPEYDQPAVLVIYDFTLPATASFPVEISLRIPGGAQLSAVAKEENGSLLNVQHQPPTPQGDYDVLTFSVVDNATHRVEFYLPYTLRGNQRNFVFVWPGDYAVQNFSLKFQEPVGATNVAIEPKMDNVGPQEDGFIYHTTTIGETTAGQEITYQFRYDKDNENLSAASLGVQPTSPLDQPVSGQASFMSFLPWILGGLGVALIVGSGLWYWLSGRSSRSPRVRKRHSSGKESSEEADEAEVFCSQCGKRAQSNDRFCRACGSRIRRAES